MSHHCFVDDTQAYVDVPRSQVATVSPQLQNCIADMSNWCGARRLPLNPTKTEVMWFGSKASLQCIPSSEKNIVVVPRARLRFGERAFSIAAPLLWNSLPAETRNVATLETFKKKLKTFMFYKHLGD